MKQAALFIVSCFLLYSCAQKNNRADIEYQLIVIDDSIILYDQNRIVGKVKLEGELDNLIINDNQ